MKAHARRRNAVRIVALVLSCFLSSAALEAGWTTLPSGTGSDLNAIYFPTAAIGYVVGSSGTIRKTTNSGATWSAQVSGTGNELRAVHFPVDALTGYAVGDNGTILNTTNGGASWAFQISGTPNALYGVHFPQDVLTGYAVGNSGTILKTTNGGTSWVVQTTPISSDLRDVHFPGSSTVGYAVGASGAILKTVNGGSNWSLQVSGGSNQLGSVHFPVDATTGYSAGVSGTMLKTTNGGSTWVPLSSGTVEDLFSVRFPAGNAVGYAVGANGTIRKTTNAGASWDPQSSPLVIHLLSVHFPVDAVTGYASGVSGSILKTTDGGGPNINYRSIGTAPNYTTGTLTATNGSATVIGAGTFWRAANRGRGDKITISSTDYTVLSVDSDTELTLTAPFTGATGSGKPYTIARKFPDMPAWEDCIDGPGGAGCEGVSSASLVSDKRFEVGIAYKDSPFTLPLDINGATTDAIYRIVLTVDPGNRHRGVAGTGAAINLASGNDAISIQSDFVTVEWLEITGPGGGNAGGIELNGQGNVNQIVIRNMLIHDMPRDGIEFRDGKTIVDLFNNVVYSMGRSGLRFTQDPTARVFNNTVFNCAQDGIEGNANGKSTFRNNIAHSNPTGDYTITNVAAGSSNNLAGDGSAPGTFPVNAPLASLRFISTAIGVEDFHIKSGSAAENVGADLSAFLLDDIDGVLRSSPWDIGADEVTAGGGPRLSSAANQSFVAGGPVATAATLTVTDATAAPVVKAALELRIRIPPGFPMRFDTAVATVSLGGSAAGKVASLVKAYEDGEKTVVLDVTTDFAAGDTLTVGSLKFKSFTAPAPFDFLQLETGNDDVVSALDDKTVEIRAGASPVLSSLVHQGFTVGQAPTPTAVFFVTDGAPGPVINVANDIRVRIPASFNMTWDTTVTVAAIGGSAASKVSASVTYEDANKTLVLDVTTAFASGEFVSVSGLSFRNFIAPSPVDNLELEVANNNVVVDEDDKTIVVSNSGDVVFFAATATSNLVLLQWVEPPAGLCSRVRILSRIDRFPLTSVDGSLVYDDVCTPGAKKSWPDATVSNGVKSYYTAFVDTGSGYTSGRTVKARPFDTTGPVKWAYSTGATSMAPPGLRFNGGAAYVYTVSNDHVLHSMDGGASGGDWPTNWIPFLLGAPAQSRPPVVGFGFGTSPKGAAFLGAQDGLVYAVNADTGMLEWRKPVASMVQAAPAGHFSAYYAGAFDWILTGTRNSTFANSLIALNLVGGTFVWAFDNSPAQLGDGKEIGIISGGASVDYLNKRIYFASRARAGVTGSTHTLWCVDIASGSPQWKWSVPIGNVDSSPILMAGVVYVGNNAGVVYAVDAVTGAVNWSLPLPDSPVKGYIFPQFGSTNVLLSTSSNVWSVADSGASGSVNFGWPVTSADIPAPSTPAFVPGTGKLLVGSNNGKLYQMNVVSPLPSTNVTLGDGSSAVGIPTVDLLNSMIYVGTDEGVIYAVQFPIP